MKIGTVKVLAGLTGNASERHKQEFTDAGTEDVLTKPYRVKDIEAFLMKTVSKIKKTV